MNRHSASLGFARALGGSFESLSINLPQGGGESGELSVFGEDVNAQAWVRLTALKNDAVAGEEIWSFETENAPKSGTDGASTRTRTVALQNLEALLDKPAVKPAIDLPGFVGTARFTVLPLDAPLGTYLPSAEDCEEEGRLGPQTNLALAREILAASGSVDLVLYPGPGFVQRRVPYGYDVTGMTVREVLNDLVLGNGVPWWLEGDVLVIDGRALPGGALSLTAQQGAGATVTFQDEYTSPSPEPQLSDYLARCAENIESEDGAGGTFETKPDGTWTSPGELSDGNAGYTAATTYTKESGRIVREVSIGTGLIATPEGDTVGPKYRSVIVNDYHPVVGDALVSSAEAVYAHADLADLYTADGVGAGTPAFKYEAVDAKPVGSARAYYTTTYRAWESLLRQSPYLTKLVKVKQEWHAEGWLRHRLEISRDLVGLLVDDVGFEYDTEDVTPLEIVFMYRETITSTSYAPIGGGLWRRSSQIVEKVDRPIMKPLLQRIREQVTEGFTDVFSTATMTNVIPDSETTDQPPPTVSLPVPDCSGLTCEGEAVRDYNADHAAWAASEANRASRRTYTVAYNHLRLNLRRGLAWGGGRITDVSHGLGSRAPGTTTATVEMAL